MTIDHELAIVGAGFGGLCLAIRLRERGERDFVILERAAEVGGTWRDNRYPGAACDVPSHLYSLSFAPNPEWTHKFPGQEEIRAYLTGLADRYDLAPHLRLSHELLSAAWDDDAAVWRIRTSRGDLTARRLVLATGGLSEPLVPALPGLDTFRGQVFHSARWDPSFDPRGKRVAVIGTGASAVQIVPALAPDVAQLGVYQRTPAWIIPRPDRRYSRLERALLRVNALRLLYRAWIWALYELRVVGLVLYPVLLRAFRLLAQGHLRAQVPDPALRARLTPSYEIGCKRILISSDFYPALTRPNVELVTGEIRAVTATGVVTDRERPVDAIVLATGFRATGHPIAERVRGRGGVSLAEAWKDGEEAYLGTVVAGFPELFLIVGPNTGLGHSSMVYMIESQVRYLLRLFRELPQPVEVKREVQAGYNRGLQARLARTVWSSGCGSWYRHASGKVTTLWPGFTFTFRRLLSRVRPDDYEGAPRALR